jgi:transcriptional regulator with XRE-family HTH domain
MTTYATERVSHAVAAEVRAQLGRQGITQAELARRIGHNGPWLSGRIGTTATVDLTIDEIAEIADALEIDASELLLAALAHRGDSKPRRYPFVGGGVSPLSQSVKAPLTLDRRARDAWELAA